METKKLHIGEAIKMVANRQGVNNAELARRIGTTRQNIALILKKDTIDVKQLFTFCEALNFDFFEPFRIDGALKEKEEPKVLLQIEIEKDKVNDVLKVIHNKELYNLIKRE